MIDARDYKTDEELALAMENESNEARLAHLSQTLANHETRMIFFLNRTRAYEESIKREIQSLQNKIELYHKSRKEVT